MHCSIETLQLNACSMTKGINHHIIFFNLSPQMTGIFYKRKGGGQGRIQRGGGFSES